MQLQLCGILHVGFSYLLRSVLYLLQDDHTPVLLWRGAGPTAGGITLWKLYHPESSWTLSWRSTCRCRGAGWINNWTTTWRCLAVVWMLNSTNTCQWQDAATCSGTEGEVAGVLKQDVVLRGFTKLFTCRCLVVYFRCLCVLEHFISHPEAQLLFTFKLISFNKRCSCWLTFHFVNMTLQFTSMELSSDDVRGQVEPGDEVKGHCTCKHSEKDWWWKESRK